MSVIFIRKPSETPNIQNLDDIRMVRYAYGNQNGYIKGYGAELSHTATGSTFSINSGIFVVQGVEVKIDANGWSESVSGVTNKRYYTVYGEVNLALEKAEVKSTYNHAMYPAIEAGDDLTQSTDGTARVELYRFTATNGIIADVVKVIKGIDYYTSLITSAINTINGRLDSLGFREGSVSLASGTATVNTVKRTGNYVIGQVTATTDGTSGGVLFTLPTNFRPKTQYSFLMGVASKIENDQFPNSIFYQSVTATVRTNGEFYVSEIKSGVLFDSYNVNFGFEAPPIA